MNSSDSKAREAFEAWWEREGQFCRAGGGDYEKTFAFRAYEAALQWAASQQAAEVEADEAELRLFEETVEQFADCGETDTPYETLMKFANRGWLECQHFVTTAEGRRVLATLEPPLFATPPSTQGGADA